MNIQFDQGPSGRWYFVSEQGQQHDHVLAVRSFPVAAPDEGIALVDGDGKEPDAVRARVLKAINQREFMPQILKLYGVSGFLTPSTWDIETDRGRTQLLLKGEEDIRRLSASVLLVTDGHGVQFLIRDLGQMDRFSRRLLDRFL
jgi:hypothetical protein